jgi:hypothetical protein
LAAQANPVLHLAFVPPALQVPEAAAQASQWALSLAEWQAQVARAAVAEVLSAW